MKNFTNYRSDFQSKTEVNNKEGKRKAYDIYISEWLESKSKKSISELNEKEFSEFKKLTEKWNNNEVSVLKKEVKEEKDSLTESQTNIIKDIFKILDFEKAKQKLLTLESLTVEEILESDNNIVINMKKFQPLTFQRVGRDRDSLEYEARRQFEEKLGSDFKKEDFIYIFNSMFESHGHDVKEFYSELNELLNS